MICPYSHSTRTAGMPSSWNLTVLFRQLCSIVLLLSQVGADQVTISKLCLESGEGFEVSFVKDDDSNFVRNWIAIHSTNNLGNPLNLPAGDMWVSLCGSQSCNPANNPLSGTVSFSGSGQLWGSSTWPLAPGTYQAVLSRALNGDSVSLAQSEAFEIGCDETSPPAEVDPPAEVEVEKLCFENGESVDLSFAGLADRPMFIGIYRENDIPDLQILRMNALRSWLWTCGTTAEKGCNQWPTSGNVQFDGLAAGEYRAVAAINDSPPFSSLAASDVFEVGVCSSSTASPATSPSNSADMVRTIQEARNDIEALIDDDQLLIGKFIRLIFHDCVGGCDGCIDMANLDNRGLVSPINSLQPVVNTYESRGLSRTDIWMLSAVVASEVSDTRRGIGFPFQWVGRKTCEQVHGDDCGLDADGEPASCGPFTGPHRAICHGDTAGTSTIHQFMLDEFGFDAQQTAAIMGAHTVGAMRDVNLGFDGRSGWDLTNDVLDHGYFIELVGDEENEIPEWEQVLHNNNDLDGIPSRWQYEATVDDTRLTMLNSDIALVRNLVEGENLEPDGRITCDFVGGNNECDRNTPFAPFMRRYADDIDDFLEDYREALDLMIDNGYARDSECQTNDVCELRSLPTGTRHTIVFEG